MLFHVVHIFIIMLQEIHSPACLPSPETASAKSSQTTASPPVEAHFDLSKRYNFEYSPVHVLPR